MHFGSGELFDQIQQSAQNKLANKPNIEYNFMGAVKKSSLLEYYGENHIDVFVNSSDMEGVPVSIMEAMSYGIPVIARNVGGNGEIVSQDVGELLPTDITAADLTRAIERFCALDENTVMQKRKAAFEVFDNEYNAEKNYTKFYGDIINELRIQR